MRKISDEENAELYESMRSDLQDGECVVFDDSHASKPTVVRFCGRELGVIRSDIERQPFESTPEGIFYSHAHALRAVKAEMRRRQFWPNIYHVNDHGNVSLWSGSGREITAWV